MILGFSRRPRLPAGSSPVGQAPPSGFTSKLRSSTTTRIAWAARPGIAAAVRPSLRHAEGWDEQRQRYQGHRAAQAIRVVVDDRSLLVKPEAALAQLEKDPQAAEAAAKAQGSSTSGDHGSTTPGPIPATGGITAAPQTGQPGPGPAPRKLSRFHGSVPVDPLRLGRDAARIAEEIVQHLTGLVGSNVEITIEIQADLAEGAGDKLVRDVTENCRTLKFTDFGFEEE